MGTRDVVGSVAFLSPLAGFAALGAIAPICVAVLSARRARGVAKVLGLPPARRRLISARLAVAIAICALPALAAAQPIVRTASVEHVRRSSQVLFVVDVSRSMLASDGPEGRPRLDRAKALVLRLRRAVPDVPAGVAGLTDRVLPYVLATPDSATFEDVVRSSVVLEAPPPQQVARTATSFGALAAVPSSGFFPGSATHRTCVLVTDGETGPYSTAAVATALRGVRGCSLVVVQVGRPDERVYGTAGSPEAAYRPDAAAAASARRLAEVTGGRAFGAGQLSQAASTLRQLAQRGASGRTTVVESQHRLAPLVAGVALVLAVGLGAAVLRTTSLGMRASGDTLAQ